MQSINRGNRQIESTSTSICTCIWSRQIITLTRVFHSQFDVHIMDFLKTSNLLYSRELVSALNGAWNKIQHSVVVGSDVSSPIIEYSSLARSLFASPNESFRDKDCGRRADSAHEDENGRPEMLQAEDDEPAAVGAADLAPAALGVVLDDLVHDAHRVEVAGKGFNIFVEMDKSREAWDSLAPVPDGIVEQRLPDEVLGQQQRLRHAQLDLGAGVESERLSKDPA